MVAIRGVVFHLPFDFENLTENLEDDCDSTGDEHNPPQSLLQSIFKVIRLHSIVVDFRQVLPLFLIFVFDLALQTPVASYSKDHADDRDR